MYVYLCLFPFIRAYMSYNVLETNLYLLGMYKFYCIKLKKINIMNAFIHIRNLGTIEYILVIYDPYLA